MPLLAPAVNLDPHPSVGGGDITLVDGTALLAQEGPEGTAADILSQPQNAQISVYTVREGDTLAGIAKMFGVDTNTIIGANNIVGGVIHPGEQLVILPIIGIRHTVVKGETLATLAKDYKSDAHDIALYNNLADDAALAVGQVILIPNGEVSVATASTKPTSSKTTAPKLTSHAAKIRSIARGSSKEPYLGGSGPAYDGYFTWPVDGGVLTQGIHGWNAVDIGAPKGTGILASADGVVIIAQSNGAWNGGYGNYVVVSHSNGTETLYAHMSRVMVSSGESVSQGQTIGLVGATGEATGPHLHFEVRGAQNPFGDLSLGDSE